MTRGFTNIPTVSAVRTGLERSSRLVSTSTERLASGQRINRAADDPGGLGVTLGLATRTRVLDRGRLNVADGISALNIADSTLELVGATLGRMLELAEGAANGAVSAAQRRTMATEYQALDREIRRLTGSTTFNGMKLLEGTSGHTVTAESPLNNAFISPEALSGDGRYVTYRTSGGAVVQLDRTSGTSTTIATGTTDRSPVASASGGVVVYQSGNNLYRWERASGQTTQLTNAQGTEQAGSLSISADGGSIAFSAVTQYQHGSSVSTASGTGSRRIYHLNLETGTISTVGTTAVAHSSSSFQLSSDGTGLVFTTMSNLVGMNADGNSEVYFVNYGAAAPSYTQVTNTTSTGVIHARIADQGQIFFTTSENVSGVNPGGSHNLIRYDTTTGSLQRLTANTSAEGMQLLNVSTEGGLVSFTTSANLTGGNSNGYNQLFALDMVSGSLRQTTTFTAIGAQATYVQAVSADGGTALIGIGDPEALSSISSFVELGASARSLVINAGSGASGAIATTIADLMATLRGAGGLAISARSGAREAIDPLRLSLDKLSSVRATIGAGMSRLDVANRLLGGQVAEYTGARALIADVDVAEEMATLTRGRILQQVGASLLASARVEPEIALSLLRF